MSTLQHSLALMSTRLHSASPMITPLHSTASANTRLHSAALVINPSGVSIFARPCLESSHGSAQPDALCVKLSPVLLLCPDSLPNLAAPPQILTAADRLTGFPGGHLQAASTETSWHQQQQQQQGHRSLHGSLNELPQQQAHRSLHGSLSELPQQQRPRALYGSLSEVGRRSSGGGTTAGAEHRNSWNSVGRFSRHALHEDVALDDFSDDQRDDEGQVQNVKFPAPVLQPICCTEQGVA